MKKNKIKYIFNFLLIAIVLSIVLYFSLKDNYQEIISTILKMNYIWIFVAILALIIYRLCASLGHYYIIKANNGKVSYLKCFQINLMILFFHGITPFAGGGQPMEIYFLHKEGIPVTKATNITLQNFIVYQIALVLLGLISIGANNIFHIFKDASILKQLVTVGFIINTLVIIGLFIIAFGKKINKWIVNHLISLLGKLKIIKNKEKSTEKWNEYINNFHNGAKLLVSNKKEFIKMILYAFLALVCLYITPVVLLYSTGDYTSFNALLSIVSCSYVMLIGSFVPIPGGTGGLEYGFIQFYGNFVTGSTLNVIMILWRFVTYYFGMIVGAVAVNIKEGEHKCE